ncbi:hypothetical protein HK102_006461 [Quaeritorhiza haematococci]|nr:hypothetical protein HK102_006461 [Quaeritorhiza haematococci]
MKVPFNPFQTRDSLEGVLYAQRQLVDQPVTTTSDVRFQSCKIDTDVLIEGNLQVTGSTTVLDTETIQLKDQIIEINADRRPMTQAGIQINRPHSDSYLFVFDESSCLFKIGTAANNQTVATIQDHPPNVGIAVWNSSRGVFDVSDTVNIPMTLNDCTVLGTLAFDEGTISVDPANRLSIASQAGISFVNSVFVPDLWIQNTRIATTPNGELLLGNPVVVPRLNLGSENVSLFPSGNTLVIPASVRMGGELWAEAGVRFGTSATLGPDPQGRLTVVSENDVVLDCASVVLPETFFEALRVTKIDNKAVLSCPTNMVLQTVGPVEIPRKLQLGDDPQNYIQGMGYDLILHSGRDVVVQSRYCEVATLKIHGSMIVTEDPFVLDAPGTVSIRGRALVLEESQPLVLAEDVSLTGSSPGTLVMSAPQTVQVDCDHLKLKTSTKLSFGALADVSVSVDQKCIIRAPNGLTTNAVSVTEFLALGYASKIASSPDRLELTHQTGIELSGPTKVSNTLVVTGDVSVNGTVSARGAQLNESLVVGNDIVRVASGALHLDRGFQMGSASVAVSSNHLSLVFPEQVLFGADHVMRYDTRSGTLAVQTIEAAAATASTLTVTGQLDVMDLVIQRNIAFPDQVDLGSTVAVRTGAVQINGDLGISGNAFLENARVDGQLDVHALSVFSGLSLQGNRIQGVASPQAGSDAATKQYVDSVVLSQA